MVGKLHHHIHHAPILDFALDQPAQDRPIDAVEKLAYIDLERVAIARNRSQRRLRIVRRLVCAHTAATRVGLIDKGAIKDRIDCCVDRVLHNKIAKRRRIDHARLRLAHLKIIVGHRAIAAIVQLAIECVQIARQPPLKIKAGALAAFVSRRRVECRQQRIAGERPPVQITHPLQSATA